MEKNPINETVSTHDLQEVSVKKSAVEDKDLEASVFTSDTQQSNSETNKEETKKNSTDDRRDIYFICPTGNGLFFRSYQD